MAYGGTKAPCILWLLFETGVDDDKGTPILAMADAAAWERASIETGVNDDKGTPVLAMPDAGCSGLGKGKHKELYATIYL